LTAAEVAQIPERFDSAAWYYDTEDPAVLMTWVRHGDVWGKVVVRMDRRVGKGVANLIVSGGVVRKADITGGERYQKI